MLLYTCTLHQCWYSKIFHLNYYALDCVLKLYPFFRVRMARQWPVCCILSSFKQRTGNWSKFHVFAVEFNQCFNRILLDFTLLRYLLNSLNFEDESMKIIASSIYSIKFENLPFSMEGKVGEITQSKKKDDG